MLKLTALASLGVIVAVGSGTKWTAVLSSTAGSRVTGNATVEQVEAAPMANPDSTKPAPKATTHASISISNAAPNSSHAWHIHSGTCSSVGGSIGTSANYQMIKVGADGSGSAEGSLSVEVGPGDHVVAVHESGAQSPTVACGELRSGNVP